MIDILLWGIIEINLLIVDFGDFYLNNTSLANLFTYIGPQQELEKSIN